MTSESVDKAKKICRNISDTSLAGMEWMIAEALDEAWRQGVEFGRRINPSDSVRVGNRDCNGVVSPFANVPGPKKMGL